jgi:hypothetical protein
MYSSEFSKIPRTAHSADDAVPLGKIVFGGLHMIVAAYRHIRGATADVREQRKPEQFLKRQFNDDGAVFSPDGQWLAYHSNESGKDEVCVRAFPPPALRQDGKWQISNSGGPTRRGRGTAVR